MQAVVIEEYGDNAVVNLVEIKRPQPERGEILVKVRAAGVNPVDWKIRDGAGQRLGLDLPIRLGGEIAGTVESIGQDVTAFEIGDAIYGIVATGGFAEYVVAPAADIARMPNNLDFVGAAATPLGGLTAWQAMFDVAGLVGGQRLLITNSSGGVGSLAIQFAKSRGVHVTALTSPRNAAFVRELGADEIVDYAAQPFDECVRDMDVVFDTMGGEAFERAPRVLKPGGFLVTSVAFPSVGMARPDVATARVHCKPDAATLATIRDLVEAGTVRPFVQTTLPLADVRQALALSKEGRTRGKIVLQIPK